MRNYINFDKYITSLEKDVYPQPPDELHQLWGETVIKNWVPLLSGTATVLDVGCGQGQFYNIFRLHGLEWTGVTLGTDYGYCLARNLQVYPLDFSFMDMFQNNSIDLIFSRHSLEHSPFPVLTLMEWHRIAKSYMILVLPNPEHFKFFGRNHYSVMTNAHALWLCARAGWRAVDKDYSEKQELRYLFVKDEPRIELMWESEGQLESEYGSHI